MDGESSASARVAGATSLMSFCSILFDRAEDREGVDHREKPAFFRDLHLGPVIESITAGREEYDLKRFFYVPLRDADAVGYRHEVLQDLEREAVGAAIRAFAERMRSMRMHLAQADKLRHRYQKERWSVDAVEIYGQSISRFFDDLTSLELRARGLLAFRRYLESYVRSPEFGSLIADTARLKDDLARVSYSLQMRGDRITVVRYGGEADYAAEVTDTFQRFQRGVVKDHRVAFREPAEMNHVEAGVLDRVALLFPDVFRALDEYCDRHRGYLDRTIADFDREVQFYLAYLEFVRRFGPLGLTFCYPRVSDRSKEIRARATFDVALANKLVSEHAPVVCNDFQLEGSERVFVVTGPNQGGKTTFARTVGQLHHLASIGCLVPGTEAQLFLCDRLFTHFEREERLTDLRGKLQDDLMRIHEILDLATPESIVILNEIFTSTTVSDALFLSTKVFERILELDLIGVWVTFVDELAAGSPKIVSMVSTVHPEDPAMRTYKIVRRPADGLAYATAIAAKYGLTYERLKERLDA